ncbi:M56 family metallopeptidase [bacterium]|nr:M56 family metallopeptidase [bacterium]
MNTISPEFAMFFASSVLHFLWLACCPWVLWIAIDRLFLRNKPAARYVGSLACLATIVLMVPVAIWMSSDVVVTSPKVALKVETLNTQSLSPRVADSSVTESPSALTIPSEPTSHANTPNASILSSGSRFVAVVKPWASTIFIGYLVGVALFSSRLLHGFYYSRQLRRQANLIHEPAILNIVQEISRKLLLPTAPIVMWCTKTAVPTVVGTLRPVVLLPAGWAKDVVGQQLKHVLMHEFIHLRRHDPFVNCLQNLAETLLFFHPLVWLVSREIRLQRELSCDAAVVDAGADLHLYANTLTDVALGASAKPQAGAHVSIAVTSGRCELRQRIDRLLGKPATTAGSAGGLSLTLLLTSAILLASLTFQPAVTSAEDTAHSVSVEKKIADLEGLAEDEFAGFVRDADGNPIKGATVDVWHWHPDDEATTDADGFFRFKPARKRFDSRVEVRISKPGFAPYYNHLQEVGKKDFIVTLNQTTYAEGTVTGTDGQPVANAKLIFDQGEKQADGVRIGAVTSTTETSADGKYRIYLAPDSYAVQAQFKAGVANAKIDVKEGQAVSLDLALREGVQFEAEVVDADTGKPVEGLVLFRWKEPKLTAISDAEGKIVIDGLNFGKMQFYVGSEKLVHKPSGITYYGHGKLGRWWSPAAVNQWQRRSVEQDTDSKDFQRNFDRLEFDIQKKMKPVRILVEQGVTFRGHVYDPDGNPVSGATVAPAKTGSGNSLTGDTRYSVKTKKDGSYEVVMPAGNKFKYNLIAHDGDYEEWRNWANGFSDPIQTKPGQVVKDFDLTLTRGGTVKGKITNPRPGLQVRAITSTMRGNRYYTPTAEVAADGSFEIKFVSPGKNFVQVDTLWMAPEHAPEGMSVIAEIAEEQTVKDIELTAVPESSQQ